MFKLEELKFLKELCDAQGVAVPMRSARLAADVYEKLSQEIKDLEKAN